MGTCFLYIPIQLIDIFNHIDPGSTVRSLFPLWTWLHHITRTVKLPVAVRRCTMAVQIASWPNRSWTLRSEPLIQPKALHISNASEGDGTITNICVIFELLPRTSWELLSYWLLRSQKWSFSPTFWDNLSVTSSRVKNKCWILKTKPLGFPETSITNYYYYYYYSPRNE